MTKGMSTMLAEKHGIRVNAVAPGPIWCAAAECMHRF
jgi:NAD(P)-dependent dehydrogenase (short-subunit alcohol dehydrogenase family)